MTDTSTNPAPTIDPLTRLPESIASSVSYRPADRVWVWRDPTWVPGVVDSASPGAVLVTIGVGGGTGVDSVRPRHLMARHATVAFDQLLPGYTTLPVRTPA